jgi:hypothetical protein
MYVCMYMCSVRTRTTLTFNDVYSTTGLTLVTHVRRYGAFSNNGGCLTSGPFAAAFQTSRAPLNQCLSRAPFNTRSLGFDRSDIDSDLNVNSENAATRYDLARDRIERRHDTVHVIVGSPGATMSTTFSPHDPIFYAHHSYIDLIWTDFQLLREGNHEAYFGNMAEALQWYGGSTSNTLGGQSSSDASQVITFNNADFLNRDVDDTVHYHMVGQLGQRRRLGDKGGRFEKHLNAGAKKAAAAGEAEGSGEWSSLHACLVGWLGT